jgi:hypothetical protein
MSSLDSLGLPSLPPLQPLEELGFGTLPPAAAAAAQPAGEWFGFSDWGDVDAPTIHAQADASGDTDIGELARKVVDHLIRRDR